MKSGTNAAAGHKAFQDRMYANPANAKTNMPTALVNGIQIRRCSPFASCFKLRSQAMNSNSVSNGNGAAPVILPGINGKAKLVHSPATFD